MSEFTETDRRQLNETAVKVASMEGQLTAYLEEHPKLCVIHGTAVAELTRRVAEVEADVAEVRDYATVVAGEVEERLTEKVDAVAAEVRTLGETQLTRNFMWRVTTIVFGAGVTVTTLILHFYETFFKPE